MITRLKRLNLPLIIGLIIVLIVIFVSIYGEQLINLDPFSTYFGLPSFQNGTLEVDNPSHEPNDLNIWGTDVLGRDVFSRIIYGAKLTIQLGVMIALFRLLVALPFSFFAGFGGKISSKIIDIFNTIFSAIPALIVSFIFLSFDDIKEMEIESAFIAYVIVLTFVGWARISTILRDRIENILSQDFIKGEIAIGKNKLQIAIENVLPHLFATIVIYYFIEISRVLLILGELGVLEVYIGRNKLNLGTLGQLGIDVEPSYYPEWGSMLSSSRYAITTWKPWMVIYPALSLFISILGFNFLGEGLKIELNKRNSKLITFIKHIPYHLSPITYIYQVKNIKRYKKSILIKTALVLGIIIYFIIPFPKSKINVNGEELYSHIEELSKNKYGGRELASEGKENTSKYILAQLEDSGIEPLFGNSYVNESSIKVDIKNVRESELYIKGDDENIHFQFQEDYNIFNVALNRTSEDTYSGKLSRKILSFDNYIKENYDRSERYFIVVEQRDNYSDDMTMKLTQTPSIDGLFFAESNDYIKAEFPIEIGDSLDKLENPMNQTGIMSIYVTPEVAEILKTHEGKEFVYYNNLEYVDKTVIKNIGGVIRGRDSTKPPMILTCDYDYRGQINGPNDNGILYNGSSIAANLEIIDTLKENNYVPERDIYFMFFDGSTSNDKKGMDAFRKTDIYKDLSENHFIICLNHLGYKDSDTLYLDTSLLNSTHKNHYNFTKLITKRAKELDINTKRDKVAFAEDGINTMHIQGSSGISIGSANDVIRDEVEFLEQNIDSIDKEKLRQQVQLIIDSITMYD
ncbi:ABC transporter permease subunit, partial [Clostridium sp. D2Q-14]|uniref:ABC transporter permease subunit n=1 Tax=Anaeromonas gelatinilytica TaxID=2683194 RepID=UPI00193C5355